MRVRVQGVLGRPPSQPYGDGLGLDPHPVDLALAHKLLLVVIVIVLVRGGLFLLRSSASAEEARQGEPRQLRQLRQLDAEEVQPSATGGALLLLLAPFVDSPEKYLGAK